MSEEEGKLFEQLEEFARELRQEEEHYGYPYNDFNPKYNLNLITSETLDELIEDMLNILTTAYEYRNNGWELTDPVRFGKIELHYNRDGEPQREEDN